MELKKPTTFNQQVELLRKKNIIITDEASCIDFLSKTTYYRLSGYYLPFIQKETEKCFIPLKFERLTKLIKKYKNDLSLKHLDFPYRWKSILKQ